MFDVTKFADGIRKYLNEQFEPLVNRIKALEAREPVPGENGKDGQDGKDGVDGKDGIDGQPGADGKDGENGADGTSFTIEDAQPIIEEAKAAAREQVDAFLNGIELPKDGKDGIDGKNFTLEEAQPILNEFMDGMKANVQAHLDHLPIPKDGAPGKDGESVTTEQIKEILDQQIAKWALDFERHAMPLLQKMVDAIPRPKDGENGKDGIDGSGFDDLSIEFDGERTLTLAFANGGEKKAKSFKLPHVIYRGIFSAESAYDRGDSVTFGGSNWIATQDSPVGKPGEPTAKGWQLAVKKGRDGKDGRNGLDLAKTVKLEPKP